VKRKFPFLSKDERVKRQLVKSAEHCEEGQIQTRITDHLPILDEHQKILRDNKDLRDVVSRLNNKVSTLPDDAANKKKIVGDMPRLLTALVDSYKANSGRQKNGYRYKGDEGDLLKNFSTLSRDLGSRQTFEFWQKNLPIPSASTVARHNKTIAEPVVEGQFRFAGLKQYLDNTNTGEEVGLSEDGTRIVGRPSYDPKSNQIVGFVPPFDENGLPKIRHFEATSSDAIKNMFETQTCSNYAYIVMAQPLADVPPYVLAVFGTNNKFTSFDVLKRWEWMREEAKKHGIVVLGVSADGDPKLLSVMQRLTFSGLRSQLPSWEDFFSASMDAIVPDVPESSMDHLCIQDIVHVGAKMKSQLLKARNDENFLPIGDFFVSETFLRLLVEEHSKSDHGLTLSDLDSKDKMNFRAVEKIVDDRVIRELESVPDSRGTKLYIVTMKSVLDAFLDKSLDACQGVYLMWRSLSFYDSGVCGL